MTKDFIKHLFPRVVITKNLKLNYTFCLGGIAFSTLIVIAITGILLLFYYQPTRENAYNSILFIESSVYAGKYIRSLHRLSSNTLLILLFLHTLRVILTGAYLPPRHLNWIVGMLLLLLSIFEGYLGYLLPMDQLSYWGGVTGMELISVVPVLKGVKTILIPDAVGGTLSLLRFYALHIVIIPLSIFSLTLLHFYKIRKNKGVLPYL